MRELKCALIGRATACDLFESRSVPDLETCPSVVDQLSITQRLCNACDARPMHAKYPRDMLMGERETLPSAAPVERQ